MRLRLVEGVRKLIREDLSEEGCLTWWEFAARVTVYQENADCPAKGTVGTHVRHCYPSYCQNSYGLCTHFQLCCPLLSGPRIAHLFHSHDVFHPLNPFSSWSLLCPQLPPAPQFLIRLCGGRYLYNLGSSSRKRTQEYKIQCRELERA